MSRAENTPWGPLKDYARTHGLPSLLRVLRVFRAESRTPVSIAIGWTLQQCRNNLNCDMELLKKPS
jgi:hypothetical protein